MNYQAHLWGELIKSRRIDVLKVSQARLAELIGVTQSAISQWEKGYFAPSVEFHPRLVQVLGLSGHDLYELNLRAGAA